MAFENILNEVADGIAIVTVNRPKKMNALNSATILELGDIFSAHGTDPQVRVVVLRGAGEKAFVAGADINELAEMKAAEAETLSRRGQALMNQIENLGKPVIAAIGGFTLGGGCELALACSFRYAVDHAKLGLPETGLGLIPGFGGTQRLARIVGRGLALEMVLTGGMVSAVEAKEMGLVNKVFSQEELMPAVMKTAGFLAQKSPLTLKMALQAVNNGLEMTQDSGCHLEAALFGVCGASDDAREGCAAFLEKRKAHFEGK